MSDAPETIEYRGRQRQVVGRLHYAEPSEPGTIVGPNGWGERCVVLAVFNADQLPVWRGREACTLVGLALVDDIARAVTAIVERGPRSELERVTPWSDFLDGFPR